MEKRKKRIKSALFILLFIILLSFLIINVNSFFKLNKLVEIYEFDSSICVSETAGIDVNKTALTFGAVTKGGSSFRTLFLENNYSFPVKIYVEGKDEMTQFIVPFSEEIFPKEKRTIKITAFVPDDTELRDYHGKVVIMLKK